MVGNVDVATEEDLGDLLADRSWSDRGVIHSLLCFPQTMVSSRVHDIAQLGLYVQYVQERKRVLALSGRGCCAKSRRAIRFCYNLPEVRT